MQGTANYTSGKCFVYIASNINEIWAPVSDSLSFSITDSKVSQSGYVTLSDKSSDVVDANSLYLVFGMNTTTSSTKDSLKFNFTQYSFSTAGPSEVLAIPLPNITLTLGEVSPRIKLTDYFIYEAPLTFEVYGQMSETKSTLKQMYTPIVEGVILGEYLGFNAYSVGTGEVMVYANLRPNADGVMYEGGAGGPIIVTVIENAQIPSDCNIILEPTVTPPTCSDKNNGTIEMSVSGGVEPYSYRWGNQRTTKNLYNVEEGVYMLSVVDSVGCRASTAVDVYTDFYAYISSSQAPTCGQSDGSIDVSCSDISATYLWNTGATEQNLTNVPAGYYTATVTSASGCSRNLETFLNDQTANPPSIYMDYFNSIYQIDCNTTDGAIYTTTSGGLEPYTYTWVNANSTTSSATNLGVGNYAVTVTDGNNCKAVTTIEITANSLYSQRGPDISSVTISEETNNMLVFWQKPQTDYIDFYTIYRERNDAPGVYDTLGTISYKDLSVFVDQNVDPKQNSWRYKLSATDFCGNESKMSYSEYKSIHLNYNMANDNTITLQWDGYEGMAFDRYSIFKITKDGKVKVAEVSPFCTRYSEKLELGTIGYVVGVEFLDTIDITSYAQLKAESGPFSLAMSNIAELENVSTKDVSLTPNANVSVKQNTIVVDNPNKSSIAVYDILGQTVAKNNSHTSNITIPVAQKGIYLVIVGNEAFKVMVQ
jgi:hypothetical protein